MQTNVCEVQKSSKQKKCKKRLTARLLLRKVMAPWAFGGRSPGGNENFCHHQCTTVAWEDDNNQKVYKLQRFAKAGSENSSIAITKYFNNRLKPLFK